MEKMPKCKVEKEFERKRAADIIKAVQAQNYSLSICEWGCRAFVSVTGIAMQNQNTDSMADFLDDGGCEALIEIMNKYVAISEKIASYACLTICILSWSLRDMKEFLGEIGACELAVFATSMHIGDPLVSEYGSGAIGLLAKENISNSLRLAESGACDVISQVANFGFALRQENACDVATNVCFAFAQLSEAQNATQLLDCGAPALVVQLMKVHIENKDFLPAAVKAICALSSLNGKHREEIGRVGGCELLVQVINLSSLEVCVIQEGCEAIMHLSLSPNNNIKFSAVGVCETLVSALRDHLMDYHCGAEVCSGAMLNLVTYGSSAKENRNTLRTIGAIQLLRSAQMSTKASYRAREHIISLLDILGAEAIPGSASNSNIVSNLYKPSSEAGMFVSVLHASEMKGDTIPLSVEVREELVEEVGSSSPAKSEDQLPMRESEELRLLEERGDGYSSLSRLISDELDISFIPALKANRKKSLNGKIWNNNHNNNNNSKNNHSNGHRTSCTNGELGMLDEGIDYTSRSSTGDALNGDAHSVDSSDFYPRYSNGSDEGFGPGKVGSAGKRNGSVYEL